jgi:ABC-type Fe3+/spermidine/putrescine transport system ATPase subunit
MNQQVADAAARGSGQFDHPGAASGGGNASLLAWRALIDPAVLLLDEPLGALDPELRRQMRGGTAPHRAVLFVHVTRPGRGHGHRDPGATS